MTSEWALPGLADPLAAIKAKKVDGSTPEFQRIAALPWCDWHAHVTTNDGHLKLTTALRMPGGTQSLWPIQAATLAYLHDYGGAFCPIPVGAGKTLVSFLAPRIAMSERPALFIPAELREKTWREYQKLFEHWVGPMRYMRRRDFEESVFNYQSLSREGGRERLFAYKPDLIVADEAQALKRRDSACTKTVEAYMHENFDTRFVALTATPTSRNPMEFWHIMMWCLRDRMPLPRGHAEANVWSDAIAEKKEISVTRPDATALHIFLKPGDDRIETVHELERGTTIAQKAFGNRFASAPGVVVFAGDSNEQIGASLRIGQLRWDPGFRAQNALDLLRAEKITPNNVELKLPMEIWKMARELACGFYYLWDPPPPEEWLAARKALYWYYTNILMRDGLLYAQYLPLNLFSPLDVANAIRQGRATDEKLCKTYWRWKEIEPTYKHDLIDVWIDDGVLNEAAAWLAREGGIVWTEHRAFGKKLSQLTGVPFCSRQGLDEQGRFIDDLKGAPVIASVRSNHKGRNLQAWSKNLIVTCPPNGAIAEQLLGRTHRNGQQADVVCADWVLACEEQDAGFFQMRADARYIENSTTQRQKLNFADYV